MKPWAAPEPTRADHVDRAVHDWKSGSAIPPLKILMIDIEISVSFHSSSVPACHNIVMHGYVRWWSCPSNGYNVTGFILGITGWSFPVVSISRSKTLLGSRLCPGDWAPDICGSADQVSIFLQFPPAISCGLTCRSLKKWSHVERNKQEALTIVRCVTGWLDCVCPTLG